MSKIVAEYDTETKDLTLTIDGENQPNPERICFNSYEWDGEKGGYFEASFAEVKQNDVRYTVGAYASLKEFAKNRLSKN